MENVYISGLDPKVPQWAKEATLKEVNKNILEVVKLLGGTTESKSKSSSKVLTEYNKNLKDTAKEQKKTKKQLQEFNKQLDDSVDDTDEAMLKLRESIFESEEAFTKSSSLTGMFGKAVSLVTSPIGLMASGLGVATLAITNLKQFVEETITSFLDIYDTGIIFQKGLFDFRLAATEAALPLNEFSKLLIENSAVVASFGVQGGRALGNLSIQTRKLVYDQMKLGASYQDINEYLGSYLETQRMQGLLAQVDRAKQSQYAAQYIKELTLYSQVLGKSRKQIDEEVKRAARRPDVFAKLASLGGELGAQAAQTFTKVSAAFSGIFGDASSEFNDAFASLIVSLNPYETDLVKTLIASGNQDVANQLITFANSIKSGSLTQEDVNSEVANFVSNLKNSNISAISNLIETRSQFAQGATSLSGILQNISSIDDLSLKRLKAGEAVPVDPFTSTIQRIGQMFMEVRAKFENIFVTFIQSNMETFEKIALDIIEFADKFSAKLQGFLTFISQIFDENSRSEALAQIKGMVISGMDFLIGAMLDSVGAYFKQKLNPFSDVDITVPKVNTIEQAVPPVLPGQSFNSESVFKNSASAPIFKTPVMVSQTQPKIITPQTSFQSNDKLLAAVNMQNQHLKTLIDINADTQQKIIVMVENSNKSNKSLLNVNRNIKNNSNLIR